MAIVSTNIIMSKIENELTSASSIEPLVWERYMNMDDVLSV